MTIAVANSAFVTSEQHKTKYFPQQINSEVNNSNIILLRFAHIFIVFVWLNDDKSAPDMHY